MRLGASCVMKVWKAETDMPETKQSIKTLDGSALSSAVREDSAMFEDDASPIRGVSQPILELGGSPEYEPENMYTWWPVAIDDSQVALTKSPSSRISDGIAEL